MDVTVAPSLMLSGLIVESVPGEHNICWHRIPGEELPSPGQPRPHSNLGEFSDF